MRIERKMFCTKTDPGAIRAGRLWLALVMALSWPLLMRGQVNLGDRLSTDYNRPVEYEIGGVTVTGVEYLDKNLLVMVSGLTVGEHIVIPGDDISKAIRKLWDQGLFEDISVVATDIKDNLIFLELRLKERPRMSKFNLKGISKSEADNIHDKINISRNEVITESLLATTRHIIKKYYKDKGFLDAEVDIRQVKDTARISNVILEITINKNKRVRIGKINPSGNEHFSDQKVKNLLKETKEKGRFTPLNDLEVPLVNSAYALFTLDSDGASDAWMKHLNENIKIRIFKASKFIEEKYDEDLLKLISKYNSQGYRDAKLVRDSIYRNPDNTLSIDLEILEGHQYYFRNISWIGNTRFTNAQLDNMLRIRKGDVYNKELLEANLRFNESGTDVSSMYYDDGYLFLRVISNEVAVENDSIDLEILIREGKQARINKVAVSGNTKTNDHVVIRELRTRPGQLFSRSDIIRTTRELANLRYFNAETITPDVIPNEANGTVDITYKVEETSADQIELSGGWGYGRIIGTLGLSFNNFSARNLFKADHWRPVPTGDGQKLSIKLSSYGKGYFFLSTSFVEPWLGGKKPNALSITYWYSLYSNGKARSDTNRSSFTINGIQIGLSKRLTWPDDFFYLSQFAKFQWYNLYQYSQIFAFGSGTGQYNNFAYNIEFGRNSISQPIYPRNGSELSVSMELTPPYSLFSKKDYSNLEPDEKFRWIEYHKWKVLAAFYTELFDKAVIMTRAKFGFLGMYNSDIGVTPFERFYLGGDGLSGYNNLDGREIVGMRGYTNESITPDYYKDKNIGGTIFSKYTLELRYPLSLNPSATIYAMGFLEGGNSWRGFADFNPFSIYRTAGIGVRVFLPMFGLLGLDWGYGFDDVPGIPNANGSQFHFSINQSID